MAPTVHELLAALPPEDSDFDPQLAGRLESLAQDLARRPTPTGAARRMWVLGGLQSKLAFAYAVYYLRNWYRSPVQQQQALLETNLRSALATVETMGYLRGAVMKIGQALATFPQLASQEFSELLSTLHFEAPPMHFALVREQLTDELGGDPEDVFDAFETEAFAAASLGQVHQARLSSGEQVVVKVQYPGIARTIRADVANVRRLLFPLRLSKDWDSLNAQFGEVQAVLESETDYRREAASQHKARAAFREGDGVVVPHVYDDYSTQRVLTMEHLPGLHLGAFLETNPSQASRDAFGERILRASLRLYFSRRLLYSDFHPGNLLFRSDGNLGWIDFGGLRRFNDEEWSLLREAHEAMCSTDHDCVLSYVQRSLMFSDHEMQSKPKVVEIVEAWANFYWKPLKTVGPFDYGESAYLQQGIALWRQAAEVRVLRQQPLNVFLHRCNFELVALLHRLGARVDCRKIYDEEITASGWLE